MKTEWWAINPLNADMTPCPVETRVMEGLRMGWRRDSSANWRLLVDSPDLIIVYWAGRAEARAQGSPLNVFIAWKETK